MALKLSRSQHVRDKVNEIFAKALGTNLNGAGMRITSSGASMGAELAARFLDVVQNRRTT